MATYRFLTDQRVALYRIIFGTGNSPARIFDIVLISTILASVLAVMIESDVNLAPDIRILLQRAETVFTVLFTLEYLLRIFVAPKPLRYMFSFFGIIDLLAILPSYLLFFFPEASYLLVIRMLRVMRIFRVFKLMRHVEESRQLAKALRASSRKILVFFFYVLILVCIFGSLIYLIEGPENGFTSIPISVYWAIITITTVGYGDIIPHTGFGKAIASLTTLIGYSIIAVPTGIITAEISLGVIHTNKTVCNECGLASHQQNAKYCQACGDKLNVS